MSSVRLPWASAEHSDPRRAARQLDVVALELAIGTCTTLLTVLGGVGWDRELLAIELQGLIDIEFDVELTGFSAAEIDLVLDEARE